MAIKLHNPTTPGRRGMTTQNFDEITAKKPVASLLAVKNRGNGRNNQGRITTRHKGGGAAKFYRLVNFKFIEGTVATVEAIEYDPNRSARIARVKTAEGVYYYILAAKDMKVGQVITSSSEAAIETGNRLALKNIPVGSLIHSVELSPGRGGQLARSAGNSAQLLAKEEEYAQVRLPSGEVRLINLECTASVGAVSYTHLTLPTIYY